MRKISLLLLCLPLLVNAQKTTYTPASERGKGYEKRKQLEEKSLLQGVSYRNVGPTVMSGRVVDLEVDPSDASHFFVAYASGGLFETKNNGTTFEPLFDHEMVMTIGDIAVDWSRNTIYVGTGESNSSRSSYSGYGLYVSRDKGKNWEHLGLEESHHIGRIILDPNDPNAIHVAAMGHLFTDNPERGVFSSKDGGKTWKKTLFINDKTGVIDLSMDPSNPQTLYAAAWQRDRKGWNFEESGPGSGIYKTTNGGDSWELISGGNSGFPSGEGVGRIGLAVSTSQPSTLYAFLDNQFRRKEESKKESKGLTKEDFSKMDVTAFLKLDEKELEEFLRNNGFPKKYLAASVRSMVKDGKIQPIALKEYLEDANSLLFDTPVTGAELYRSDDGGKSWKKTHEGYLDDLVFTYGYYFGNVRVHPQNPEKVYLVAFVVLKSEDGGKTFTNINGENVHVDHHALYIDPDRDGHLINGNDGGVNISYDDGKTWIRCNQPAVGQFYTVNVDMEEPYNIYGGLQDNGVWYGPSTYTSDFSWQMEGQYPWKTVLGGDGMQVGIDTRDNRTIYTGYQFGHYYRIDKKTGKADYITPKHELGERPYRWNWQSPLHISVHNQDVIYFGANKLFRSFNQGNDFVAISNDLTKGGKPGDVSYGTITAIHESPLRFGLIYTGSDDGLIHITQDGSKTWRRISDKLPQDFWVREVQASLHKEERVYVCLNGHTLDNFQSHIYVSEDLGATWKKLGTDLPMEPVNVIKEDPINENILYIGTDHGVYVSLDRGQTFMAMNNNMPNVPVHDLVIHPRDKDIVVATHGRSIYVASVKEVQQLTSELMQKELHVFTPKSINWSDNWGNSWSQWEEPFESKVDISWWSKVESKGELMIKDRSGSVLKKLTINLKKGINKLEYHLDIDGEKEGFKKSKNGKSYLKPGSYTIEISRGTEKAETEFAITEK